jgi:hypothetical protein
MYAHTLKPFAVKIREAARGRHLAEVRDQVDRGLWLNWLNAEFGWSDQTAYRFIHVFELSRDAELHTLVESDLPLGVLYRLAAPKAEDVRKEITERVKAGEPLSRTMVQKALTEAKGGTATTAALGAEGADAAASDEARKAQYAEVGSPSAYADQVGSPDANLAAAASVTKATPAPARSSLTDAWDATPEERQFIGDFVLNEFFAGASGADIFERIPEARRTDVARAFLDQLGIDGMLAASSAEFRRALCIKLPGKPKRLKNRTRRASRS